MSWHTVQLEASAPQAWKNGGGLTRELLAWPSAGDWRIRLSVADIATAGPFSTYDGVHRWFAVLEGNGVRLNVNGEVTELRAESPAVGFPGSAHTSCSLLGGPTRDFNLMLRGATGCLLRVQGRAQGRADLGVGQIGIKFIACYAINTRAKVSFGNADCLLEPGTLAWRLVDAHSTGTDTHWSAESSNALWMESTT